MGLRRRWSAHCHTLQGLFKQAQDHRLPLATAAASGTGTLGGVDVKHVAAVVVRIGVFGVDVVTGGRC
jgi:hypothetical protein